MSRVEILWLIESRCNYDCPYCFFRIEEKRLGQVGSTMRRETAYPVEVWAAAWERFEKRYGCAKINITGSGEPTMYPGFYELFAGLSRRHYVVFDTNLTWPEDTLRRFVSEMDRTRVEIDTSFHPHTANVEEFVAKASILKAGGFTFNCRLVVYPDVWDRVSGFQEKFAKAGLPLVLSPFHGDFEGRLYPDAYTAEQKRRILGVVEQEAKQGSRAWQPKLVEDLLEVNVEAKSPLGRPCRSGADYACLMPNGLLYRCQVYGSEDWEPFGHFVEGDYELRRGPLPCKSSTCAHEKRWLVESHG